jgi:hypothetical protein
MSEVLDFIAEDVDNAEKKLADLKKLIDFGMKAGEDVRQAQLQYQQLSDRVARFKAALKAVRGK